ncbi:gastrin/cholecystokinin type B receptor-like [Haliotis rubra]|uniref:gastrin/cholecystokinin type B receptor-like n=1 Tax=Haliotis rubra TaxID=36100 RepID=UPI001EE55539|nr:gastrin/cholecystokinin type B receptor-like [Haliotis rubra]
MSFNITSVYEYNNAFARLYMPVIVFLVVLLAVGVVGNSLVCYVYYVKFKPSNNRCFIVIIGILDLLTCVVSIPLHILELNYNATFGTFGLCELIMTCVTFFSMSSAAVLVVVAVDRYRKICQPFKRQMTPFSAKISSVIVCVVSGLFSIPSSVIDGPRTISLGEVNATICSQRDEDSDLHIVYSGIQIFLFVGALVSLVVLYGLIWHQIRRKQTIRRRFSECKNTDNTLRPCLTGQTHSARTSDNDCCQPLNCDTTQVGEENNANTVIRTHTYRHEADNGTPLNLIQNNVRCESGSQSRSDETVITYCFGQASSPSFMPALSTLRPTSTPAHSQGKHGTGKITMVLFLITLVFILSYLPYLALTVARSTHPDILDETPVAGAILERSYFIQSISNPLIYSFCNAIFRRRLRSMCRCTQMKFL